MKYLKIFTSTYHDTYLPIFSSKTDVLFFASNCRDSKNDSETSIISDRLPNKDATSTLRCSNIAGVSRPNACHVNFKSRQKSLSVMVSSFITFSRRSLFFTLELWMNKIKRNWNPISTMVIKQGGVIIQCNGFDIIHTSFLHVSVFLPLSSVPPVAPFCSVLLPASLFLRYCLLQPSAPHLLGKLYVRNCIIKSYVGIKLIL